MISRASKAASPLFTVFTPTFNRKHTLPRVYRSLCEQTYRNFEWLVVDDGSTDDTDKLVRTWQQEGKFPIRYSYKANGGKHTAYNLGVKQAAGELFLLLDSDDACVPHALERFKFHWESIPHEDKGQFSGVTAHCMDHAGRRVGSIFPHDFMDVSPIELWWIKGEKWGVHRTDVLREFPYPEIPGETFAIEGIVWNRIALRYKMRFVNECLRIYFQPPDGLNANLGRLRARNPHGARLYYWEYMGLPIPVSRKTRAIVNYIRFSLHAQVKATQMLKESPFKSATAVAMLAGYLAYRRDRLVLSMR